MCHLCKTTKLSLPWSNSQLYYKEQSRGFLPGLDVYDTLQFTWSPHLTTLLQNQTKYNFFPNRSIPDPFCKLMLKVPKKNDYF